MKGTLTKPMPVRSSERSQAGTLGWTLLMLPVALWLIAVFFLPVAQLLAISVYTSAGPAQWVRTFTLANYVKFLSDPFFLQVLLRSCSLALATTAICVAVGYPAAYFLARTQSRLRPLLILLIVAPLLISVVIRGLGWMVMLSDQGIVNWFFLSIGLINAPLSLLDNFLGVLIGLVHAMLPLMIIILINSIQKVERSLEEASLNLGAGKLRTFFRLVVPLTREGLLGGSLVVFTVSIAAFTTPAMLGGRRALVMPILIEQQVRFVLNHPFGAANSVILLAFTLIVTYLITVLVRRGYR